MRSPIRHGEILLLPVDALPKNPAKREQHTNYIVGHSETGHHHVLESDTVFEEIAAANGDIFLNLVEDAQLVHLKEVEAHRTLPVVAGGWRVIKKTEYRPQARAQGRLCE